VVPKIYFCGSQNRWCSKAGPRGSYVDFAARAYLHKNKWVVNNLNFEDKWRNETVMRGGGSLFASANNGLSFLFLFLNLVPCQTVWHNSSCSVRLILESISTSVVFFLKFWEFCQTPPPKKNMWQIVYTALCKIYSLLKLW